MTCAVTHLLMCELTWARNVDIESVIASVLQSSWVIEMRDFRSALFSIVLMFLDYSMSLVFVAFSALLVFRILVWFLARCLSYKTYSRSA